MTNIHSTTRSDPCRTDKNWSTRHAFGTKTATAGFHRHPPGVFHRTGCRDADSRANVGDHSAATATEAATTSKVSATALRFFNVYGPGQNQTSGYASVIPNFVEKMMKGERPTIFGDGLQTRSFLYIDDSSLDMYIKGQWTLSAPL